MKVLQIILALLMTADSHESCSADKNQFECGNGECLEHDQVCDGYINCDDSSDEQNCEMVCKVCLDGYYMDSTTLTCNRCPENCVECDSQWCQRCNRGYEVKDHKCQEKDMCQSNPCQNGAQCKRLSGGRYTCGCGEDFYGRNCEKHIDECGKDNPCQNGGTCEDVPNGYKCVCPPMIAGKNCDKFAGCPDNCATCALSFP